MRPPQPVQQTDNKRLFIAVGVSMLVLLLWQLFFSPEPPKKTEEDTATSASADDDTAGSTAAPAPGVEGAAASPPAVIEPAEVVLEADAYKLVLTNIGARAVAFHQKRPERFVGIDYLSGLVGDIDLASPPGYLPFATTLRDIGLKSSSRFTVVSTGAAGDATADAEATFAWTSATGLVDVTKRFRPGSTDHAIELVVTVNNRGQQPIDDTLILDLYDRQVDEGSFFIPGGEVTAICLTDDDVERVKYDDDEERFTTDVVWAGVDESYFAIIARAVDGADSCTLSGGDNRLVSAELAVDLEVPPGEQREVTFEIYMGPKEKAFLQAFGSDIDRAIDYGFFEILARPMAWLLRKFYDLVANWGLAIILLTILIRGALWPITQRSQESMMRMKDLQPELEKIKAKYPKDRKLTQAEQIQQAQEQSALMKKHGVSPLGCLPLVLQLPIWIALYRTIFVTAELYRAPFAAWIQDLSAPDPYFVLPVSAGLLFFVQQRLTPTTAMNTQQKVIMTVFPIIFSVAMLFFPSGLNLYILVSSIIGMIQAFYTRKKVARRAAATATATADHAPRSADERRAQQRRDEREKRKAEK